MDMVDMVVVVGYRTTDMFDLVYVQEFLVYQPAPILTKLATTA